MTTFWQKLPKPFTVLAPMDGVTDFVFRQMILKLGRPDVLFTEFTPVDGILSVGKSNVLSNLKFNKNEHPIVAQIWGHNPEHFYKATKTVAKLGFDGIDINMGCPDKTTMKYGACGALIKTPYLAKEIIYSTKKAAKNIPVSVKTRIGFEKEIIEEWIGFLLSLKLSALTVHLRTVDEQSKVPAHWELMGKIAEMRNKISPNTVLIGNGDIATVAEIRDMHKKYMCEGFMVGRGVFHNPWIFNSEVNIEDVDILDRLNTYIDHIDLYNQTWGTAKNHANVRKFCKTYINNFPDASKIREELMETRNLEELKTKIESLLSKNHNFPSGIST